MGTDLARTIAEAYRWQRRLGHRQIPTPHCHIVADPAHPEVWDSNHADAVTAETEAEIDAVFAAMERHIGHCSSRVIHTDGFTPDAFLARLALDGFEERPVTIQMVLRGEVTARGAAVELRPVASETDWDALYQLARADHIEGRRTKGIDIPPEVSAGLVAGYRAKRGSYHFHLAIIDGAPVAYGAHAAAPNGAGMVEDLFTLPSARRRGIATAMIARFTDRLRASGCHTVFIGALANEAPKRLYARLGFHPATLSRAWVKAVR